MPNDSGPADGGQGDEGMLQLFQIHGGMTVGQLGKRLGITGTAVRQRLNRLMGLGLIERMSQRQGRGRPSHHYALTAKGRRQGGANFSDLAIALWEEMRAIPDASVRRGLLQRVSQRLARMVDADVTGRSVGERMESIARIFSDRRIPFTVDRSSSLPVLTAHACPYPDLAEQDRTVCAMERIMFSELLGETVRLTQCRLDNNPCCTFSMSSATTDLEGAIPT